MIYNLAFSIVVLLPRSICILLRRISGMRPYDTLVFATNKYTILLHLRLRGSNYNSS